MITLLRLHEHSYAFGWRQGEIFAEIGIVTSEEAFHAGYFFPEQSGKRKNGWWRIEFCLRLFFVFFPPFRMVEDGN